ncbi:PREDICTED: acid-sensing ion channel 3-like [Priapulus caudatus]|uniref:Acid-sensing ion channel 3-like n=1 Tax=Priapulus caudatus TaxID=37621 RepID=A0ABM1EZY3_PRICU|nr:PREDICTED: acid-sensing ion channel 3-like [Priapulus caudatus]
MSSHVAPSVRWSKVLNRSLAESRQNLVALEVHYSSVANRTVWNEPSYSAEELICDIGGLMGAFAGASLLTILELLHFICNRRLSVPPSGGGGGFDGYYGGDGGGGGSGRYNVRKIFVVSDADKLQPSRM